MNQIRKIIFDKLNKKYPEEIPVEINERITEELRLVKAKKYARLILDLILIKEELQNMMLIDLDLDKENFTITGSINDLYLAYLLEITKFNPLLYNIPVPKHIRVGINLPEGEKANFFKKLNKRFNNNVKILDINKNYFVIDHYNELKVIGDTNIINCTKGEINLTNNLLIYIDEKRILTLLNDIYRYIDIDIKYLDKIDNLKTLFTDTYHKTTFEELFYDNNQTFNYHYLSQESKEYELTYIKYYYPKIYYYVVINNMMKDIPINILNKYKNNYDLAIDYYINNRKTYKEESILSFYKLCKDAKNKFGHFSLNLKKKKVIWKNLMFIEHRVGDGMVEALYNQAREKSQKNKVLIFILDGDVNWYISKFISKESDIDYWEILSLLNPLNYKYDIDINNISEVIKAINKLKLSNINISNNYNDIFAKKYDVIIIDSLEDLCKKTSYTLNYLLNELNNLNKEIIIFDKVKEIFKINEKIKLNDVKFLNLKKKYMQDIYYLKDKKIERIDNYD